jgi:hypothetical protein
LKDIYNSGVKGGTTIPDYNEVSKNSHAWNYDGVYNPHSLRSDWVDFSKVKGAPVKTAHGVVLKGMVASIEASRSKGSFGTEVGIAQKAMHLVSQYRERDQSKGWGLFATTGITPKIVSQFHLGDDGRWKIIFKVRH